MNAGDVIRVPYPFYWGEYEALDEGGPHKVKTWMPGTYAEFVGPDSAEDFADGMGEMVLTVVSVHKPGRFPTRVFYTRQWIDPSGNSFGKNNCRITTSQQFKRMAKGYLFPFSLDNDQLEARSNG